MSFNFNNLTSYAAYCEQVRLYYHLRADTQNLKWSLLYHHLIATVPYQKAPYLFPFSVSLKLHLHVLPSLYQFHILQDSFLFGICTPGSYKERSSTNIYREKE